MTGFVAAYQHHWDTLLGCKLLHQTTYKCCCFLNCLIHRSYLDPENAKFTHYLAHLGRDGIPIPTCACPTAVDLVFGITYVRITELGPARRSRSLVLISTL